MKPITMTMIAIFLGLGIYGMWHLRGSIQTMIIAIIIILAFFGWVIYIALEG